MQPLDSSSSNPVSARHNEFVGVRHEGCAALQETLWQRCQDRGEVAAGAQFSKSQLQHLRQAGGRLYATHVARAARACGSNTNG